VIPQEIYCEICGEWTGKIVYLDFNQKAPLGEHENVRECVRNLSGRVKKLERILDENGIYA